jgi:hypothetical protein
MIEKSQIMTVHFRHHRIGHERPFMAWSRGNEERFLKNYRKSKFLLKNFYDNKGSIFD